MNQIKLVYIFVTNKCQLSCEYCLHKRENSDMSLDTAKKVVKYLKDCKCQAVVIYGGEPLLNFPVVKYLIENLEDSMKIGMSTNGIELSGEVSEYLAKKKSVKMSISMDPNMERRSKKFALRIRENAKDFVAKCHSYGGTVEVNSVVFKKNEQEEYIKRIQSILIDEIGFDGINSTCFGNAPLMQFADDIEDWLLKGYRPPNIAINEYIKVHSPKVTDYPDCFQCKAGNRQITVTVDGDIYACHKFYNLRMFQIGDIDSGIDQAKLAKWYCAKNMRNAECKQCDFYKECLGGCTYQHYLVTNKFGINDKHGCDVQRSYLKKGKEIYDHVMSKGSEVNIALLESNRLSSNYGKRFFNQKVSKQKHYDITLNTKYLDCLTTDNFNIHPEKEKYTLYFISSRRMLGISGVIACILEIYVHEGLDATIAYLEEYFALSTSDAVKIIETTNQMIKRYIGKERKIDE